MKRLQPLSFVLGLISGALALVIIVGGMRMVFPQNRRGFPGGGMGGNFQQNGGPNLARMAQRFGMTEAELQKELDAGKTMPEIAQEHGAQFNGRGFRGGDSSSTSSQQSGSGAGVSSQSSSAR